MNLGGFCIPALAFSATCRILPDKIELVFCLPRQVSEAASEVCPPFHPGGDALRKTFYWIKLYHELLTNSKMAMLDDHTWRRTIELFLIAGDYAMDGLLPPVEEIAWDLHTTQDDILTSLGALELLGVVATEDQETWVVVNFARRQAAVTSAERSRLYRQRQNSPVDDYGR